MTDVFSTTAAQSKRPREDDDAPAQEPMRPTRGIRTSLSTDQRKVRRAMTRGERVDRRTATLQENTTTKGASMYSEADILQAMAKASPAEQPALVALLDSLRSQRTAAIRQERDLDLAGAVVAAHLTPVATHVLHTASTDWLDAAAGPQGSGDALSMKTKATLWFQQTSAEVRADREEFAIQAQGMASREASAFGLDAPVAERAFLDHVAHLYATAADARGSQPISGDQQSGNAESTVTDYDGLAPVTEDPFLGEDWQDGDTGVHPSIPGAGDQTPPGEVPVAEGESESGDGRAIKAGSRRTANTVKVDLKTLREGDKVIFVRDGRENEMTVSREMEDVGSYENRKVTLTMGPGRFSTDVSIAGIEGGYYDVKPVTGTTASRTATEEVPAWPWELGEEPEGGQDAADVADVRTPGGEAGYPQPTAARKVAYESFQVRGDEDGQSVLIAETGSAADAEAAAKQAVSDGWDGVFWVDGHGEQQKVGSRRTAAGPIPVCPVCGAATYGDSEGTSICTRCSWDSFNRAGEVGGATLGEYGTFAPGTLPPLESSLNPVTAAFRQRVQASLRAEAGTRRIAAWYVNQDSPVYGGTTMDGPFSTYEEAQRALDARPGPKNGRWYVSETNYAGTYDDFGPDEGESWSDFYARNNID